MCSARSSLPATGNRGRGRARSRRRERGQVCSGPRSTKPGGTISFGSTVYPRPCLHSGLEPSQDLDSCKRSARAASSHRGRLGHACGRRPARVRERGAADPRATTPGAARPPTPATPATPRASSWPLRLALEQHKVVLALGKPIEQVDGEVAVHVESDARMGTGKAGQHIGQVRHWRSPPAFRAGRCPQHQGSIRRERASSPSRSICRA
jgi:hypothetical protein